MMKPDSKGSIFLESKKDMKARGLASPDAADAIALTFSYPVASRGDFSARTERRVVSERGMVSTSWMGS
jgi:phage terminase large subunit